LVPEGSANAQQVAATPRVGYLNPFALGNPRTVHNLAIFRQRLVELGYTEGQTLTIEYRGAEGTADRLSSLAAELVSLRVDVIVVAGPVALKAARKVTGSVPIVALDLESDPVADGFASSLARPGGNVTGIFLDQPELGGKWLELLKAIVPTLSRVAVLWDASTPSHQMRAVEEASKVLGVKLQRLPIRDSGDFEAAYAAGEKGRAQGLVILTSPLMPRNAGRLAELAAAKRMPTISSFRELAMAGCLLTYGPNQDENWRRVAGFVVRILKGAKPADLPVERPERFELVINMKTAKALGLTIPQSLLNRADQVIQ
jgi:putative ABC transport system substrate-binding protein